MGTNLIAFVVIVFVYIPSNIFAICNENWLNVVSFDDARKVSFVSNVLFAVFAVCNHIMLQAQAKRKMVAGARRMSAVVRRASVVVRRSFMEAIGGGNNKICVGPIDDCLSTTDDDESEKKNANRFSI